MSASSGSRDSMPESITRTTKEGRKLNYQLTVIQQPERARACGAGAKSSADRRPVDPPPVVELRIFEFAGPNERKDITFSYNANFFLYATLETARPIAQGRIPSSQQPPVLTGMPVSGMAYLDRPQEAGYFIFPDLSVRHEGKYKLSFNLYEETKDAKDQDAEGAETQARAPASGPSGSFDWRLEVKSMPFTVYSAKKFPGLAESTALSRTVAEQGCRVRIRRDVRMRRRDGKEESSAYDMENEYERLRRTASPVDTPHEFQPRPRSMSNASIDRQSFSDGRPPVEQYPPQHQGYAQPQAPQTHGSAQFAQYPPQHSSYAPAPMPTQQQRFAVPPAPGATTQQAYYQTDYARQGSAPSEIFARDQRAHHESQMRERDAYERAAYDDYYRRASVGYTTQTQAPQHSNYARSQSVAYPPPPSQQFPARAHTPVSQPHVALAPLKMPPMEPKHENTSPTGPISGGSRMSIAAPLDRSSFGNGYASGPQSAVLDAARNGKRAFDSVFSSSAAAYNQPLHNGMRPTSVQPHASAANFDDDDDAADMEALKMQYKRADGHIYSRELPTLQ